MCLTKNLKLFNVLNMNPESEINLQAIMDVFTSGITDWGSLHPILIHFPIALFFVAPVFIILGLVFSKSAKTFFTAAVILMALGILFMFLSTSSGEAAVEILPANPEFVPTLELHYVLAEKARLYFCVLSVLFLAYTLFFQKLSRRIQLIAVIIFLAAYALSLIVLFNAAHHGAELVHRYGVQSQLFQK